MNITIHKASKTDILDISVLDKEIFGKDCYPEFVLRQFYDFSNGLFWVAKYEDEVVGYSLGAIDFDSCNSWILSLGVSPMFQNKGIGKKLTTQLINVLKGKKVRKISLTVSPKNINAIHLYESVGFKKVLIEYEYYGKGEDRIIMELVNE